MRFMEHEQTEDRIGGFRRDINILDQSLEASQLTAQTVLSLHIRSQALASAIARALLSALRNGLGHLVNAYYSTLNLFQEGYKQLRVWQLERLAKRIAASIEERYPEIERLSIEPPPEFICPISLCLMANPVAIVTIINGEEFSHYVEKSSFERWQESGRSNNSLNPFNRQPIVRVQPATELQNRIQVFVESQISDTPRSRM